MKVKIGLIFIILLLVLTACGQKKMDQPITLLNQDQGEITFPSDKPVLFFFITTYT